MASAFTVPDSLGNLAALTATIANGASLSDAQDLQGFQLIAIAMPAAWTAANVTFQASADNVTYFDLYDQTSEINYSSAAASRYLTIPPSQFAGVRFIRVRSGTTGTPVNQAAQRLVTLLGRRF